jgi:hypothetical protein
LNGLYCTLKNLPFIAISVGIHKEKMNRLYPHWNIFTTAWTFLAERFDMFLCGEGLEEFGRIIIDKSDNLQTYEATKILQNLIENGTNQRSITRIYNNILFFPSYSHYGLQLADAISYCILRNLNGYNKFSPYWEIVKMKTRRNEYTNEIWGYGYKIFPN